MISVWRTHVRDTAKGWLDFNLDWLHFTGPVHMVHYEDLLINTTSVLRTLLHFLGFHLSPKLADCIILNKEGNFHRQQRRLGFDPYDSNMKAILANYEQTILLQKGIHTIYQHFADNTRQRQRSLHDS